MCSRAVQEKERSGRVVLGNVEEFECPCGLLLPTHFTESAQAL